ncbi:hypothetical protein ACTJJ0_10910 [Chitinophaga sp. 22321]|uniref:RteC protein n=1 Tax=Chitinophaga hostae TaxID=2831022 RepID=A0ABS5ISW3_9BACT|nr:hypothetical protein [Chitinophaga hostae]MBS0026054.1 hypothetical protein [Chitinophaga hostae]
MQYKEEFDLLRQQIPIVIRHGLNLLSKSNGNINEARRWFEEEMIQVIIHKTSVSPEVAQKHLLACEYDIARTIAGIDEERFTLSERILRKAKDNKEKALDLIGHNLEDAKKIERKYWLKLDELEQLSPVQYCLLAVKEWLDYEDYEGFSCAVYFYLDIAAQQIEEQLLLPELANGLRAARKISNELFEQHKRKSAAKKFPIVSKLLNENPVYISSKDGFRKIRPVVIDRLYDLVVNNIEQFS